MSPARLYGLYLAIALSNPAKVKIDLAPILFTTDFLFLETKSALRLKIS